MWTRLTLTQRLSREAGVNFIGPITTIGQTGKYGQLVEWIDTAYNDIQSLHPTWKFLRKEFSHAITSPTAVYTPADFGLTSFKEWVTTDMRLYLLIGDEADITYYDWEDFRAWCGLGNNTTLTQRPYVFTVKPDDSLQFWPIPNDTYTCRGEYFRANHAFTADADVPLFHDDFSLAIMWRALMFYGTDMSEGDKFSRGSAEYLSLIRKLEKKYLPRVTWGRPLA
jgi:hypothetical protein